MADRKFTRADIVALAQHNPCLFRYNFWTFGAVAFAPIPILILIFSPPSTQPFLGLWIMLVALMGPFLWLTQAILIPQPMAGAFASLHHRKPAIWVDGDQLHFFAHVVAMDQIDYLVRKPKYGFGDFELHMVDGREHHYADAFVTASFAES